MSIALVTIVLVAVAALLTWLSLPSRPIVYKGLTQQKLLTLLDALLYRGVDGSTLRVESKTVLIVAEKYVSAGAVGIRLIGPVSGVPLTQRPSSQGERSAQDYRQDIDAALSAIMSAFESESIAESGSAVFTNLLPMEVPRLTGVARSSRKTAM